MATLKKDVITNTLAEVKIVYLNREVSKWWNANRSPEDTVVFCGWFWLRGSQESGPFRTRSAALRDAYYQHVLHEHLPKVWSKNVLPILLKNRPKQATKKQPMKKRPPKKRSVPLVEGRPTA